MQVGVPKETAANERRVSAVPKSVGVMTGWGWDVLVERGAGDEAGFPDQTYVDAGATLVDDAAGAHATDVVLRVAAPSEAEVALLAPGTVLIGFLDPFVDTDLVTTLADRQVTAISVEAIPRTTLAQSMDALSSQATVGGYAAMLLAAEQSPRFLPMLITAAGTIPPSKALILGVGVAGLQAIATAKRLGAVVHAYDIRSETKEQVESLGAKFVEAPTTEADEGGYAKEVDADVQQRQLEALAKHVAESDLIVTTAQIPGKPAPTLVNDEMVRSMHAGAVIVDMAAATGGNVEGSVPDELVVVDGVKILGPTDLASRVPTDASRMYGRNLQALLERLKTDDGITIDLDDEIVGGCTITHNGEVVHPVSRRVMGLAAADEAAKPGKTEQVATGQGDGGP